ncbi:MAG: molybdenum metabolism regulator [Campylobacterales bacterium]|nr:molybdenum metabolism regulator [Campylobacterales bacterium]
MTTILYRTVNERERYYLEEVLVPFGYTIQLLPNLFGESLVIRTYGSKKNVKATRTIQEVYATQTEAHHKVDVLIASKRQRGYYTSQTVKGSRHE